jgi:hypothetical protein
MREFIARYVEAAQAREAAVILISFSQAKSADRLAI